MTETFLCPACQHGEHLDGPCVCSCRYHKTLAAAADRLHAAIQDFKLAVIEQLKKLLES